MNFARCFSNQYINKKENKKNKTSVALYPNFVYSVALAKFWLETENSDDVSESEYKQHAINIPKDALKNVSSFDLSFYDSSHQWLMTAILLYPKILIELLEKTELIKQNPAHSNLVGQQKTAWKELLQHDSMLRNENEYNYWFLNMTNDEDIEGIKKVVSIYPQRNKLLWKSTLINLWMKSVAGFLIDSIDSKNLDFSEMIEKLTIPPTENSKELGSFNNLRIPFEPKVHKGLIPKDFSDETEVMDLNNIPDDAPIQNAGNMLNMNQNAIGLFVQSLLPWNNIPQQNQGQGDQEDGMWEDG